MKIALITDTHFGCRNDNLSFIEYFRKFYAEIFFPYLKNHNIDTIVHLGDIVDRRKFINFNSLKAMHDIFIQPIIDNDITLHAIIGNHDTYYKNTNEINSMQQLYGTIGYEKIKWYGNSPELINIDGCEIMLLPWICSGNYERFMSEVEKTKAQILFGHLELKGFEMHKGAINYDGFDPNVFNKFDIVCSGHFHHKSTSGNINYLGSPYEMTWADYNDPRGFHIFDTETRELVFVRNTLKMFHKIVYDDSNTTLDEIVNKHFDKFNECYVKVIIREKNNPYWFDLFMEKIEKSNPVHVQVVEDHLNLDLENDDTIVSEAEDTITILNKYIDGLDINVDKQNLEKIIKELYSEALSVG